MLVAVVERCRGFGLFAKTVVRWWVGARRIAFRNGAAVGRVVTRELELVFDHDSTDYTRNQPRRNVQRRTRTNAQRSRHYLHAPSDVVVKGFQMFGLR